MKYLLILTFIFWFIVAFYGAYKLLVFGEISTIHILLLSVSLIGLSIFFDEINKK